MRPLAPVLEQEIRLDRLELLELTVPQLETFRSAVGVRKERRALFVRWHAGDGAWGLGECSCRPDPYFNGEFVAGAREIIARFIVPSLPRQGTIAGVHRVLQRIRNWPFTTAAVLDAAFDLQRRRGLPDPIDLWPGERLERVPVGISLGIFENAGQAVERITRELEEGYRRIKLKIQPAMNLDVLAAVRAAFPEIHLAFDANGSFGEDDFDLLERLAALHPAAVEQPFPPQRVDLCSDFKHRVPDLPLCLDESLTGLGPLRTARRAGALDEVNLKPGRVGGLLESVRMLDECRRHDLPAWVGGMFETGVGRSHNLRVASCLPHAEAHDLSPSRRYFTVDVLTRPIEMDADGHVPVPAEPVEVDEETLESLLIKKQILRPP